MKQSFNGPDILSLQRINTFETLDSMIDGSRFLLISDGGSDIKILSIYWNGPHTVKSLFVEGFGAILPFDSFNDERLMRESLYLLAGKSRTQHQQRI